VLTVGISHGQCDYSTAHERDVPAVAACRNGATPGRRRPCTDIAALSGLQIERRQGATIRPCSRTPRAVRHPDRHDMTRSVHRAALQHSRSNSRADTPSCQGILKYRADPCRAHHVKGRSPTCLGVNPALVLPVWRWLVKPRGSATR
jgi:hypothetical protein